MISDKRRQIIESLQDKEYRDLFVAEHISQGIAFQIRAMRESRLWTQAELGQRVGKAQETISQLENPDYGNFTLKTLKRLASAFDVALIVRFAAFSKVVDMEVTLSPDDLAVPSFDNDHHLEEPALPVMVGSRTEARFVVSGGTIVPELRVSHISSGEQLHGTVAEDQPQESTKVVSISEWVSHSQAANRKLVIAGTR